MIRLAANAPLLVLVLALGACAPPAEDSGDAGATPAGAIAASPSDPPTRRAPEGFAATAWRAIGEDGARFTTYLDPDGTYRDLRNGDPWQQGSWSYTAGDDPRLCYTPDDENAVKRCWTPGAMSDGTMEATGEDGRRIELERVDYAPPADAAGEDPATK